MKLRRAQQAKHKTPLEVSSEVLTSSNLLACLLLVPEIGRDEPCRSVLFISSGVLLAAWCCVAELVMVSELLLT